MVVIHWPSISRDPGFLALKEFVIYEKCDANFNTCQIFVTLNIDMIFSLQCLFMEYAYFKMD